MKSFYKSNADRREPRWGCDVAAKCTRCRTWTTCRVVVLFKEGSLAHCGCATLESQQYPYGVRTKKPYMECPTEPPGANGSAASPWSRMFRSIASGPDAAPGC